ncbi:MAG: hypothetical protein NOF05_02325 [Candidatus Accumulibacter phosphatis]|uniref:Uncharacterized protein n=1 Tax=Candidatus Accumulibacter cognatus TaxID=2954383 RepID=A0A7D5NA51_9PROT|nr:hypothetical protein [Accumulibacter sp.]MBO3713321.1 hypothetical protein [Accumulibacter sp.]MCQ1547665.1 hypothetical protein [Candidatus Accumulibacter phosphatis]QLH49387.1 MAG: hypothetical protein HWD57_06015 [Candidatus Accumulibacter cognatus]
MKKVKPALTPAFRKLAVKRGKAAAKGTPKGEGNRRVTPEERELPRLRAEHGRLKQEREIVVNAAE